MNDNTMNDNTMNDNTMNNNTLNDKPSNNTLCRRHRIGIAAVCMTLLASCSNTGIEVTQLPQRIDYRCNNNKVLQIKRAPDASAVAVLINEKVVTLPRAESATQEKYTDGMYSLYLQGERAMLDQNSQVLFGPCNAGPLPKKTIEGFDER